MAKQKGDVNKSEEIRQLLKATPRMPVPEVIAALAAKGITVSDNLVHYVRGKLRGRSDRRQKVRQRAARAAATVQDGDAVAAILKVKAWAAEVGGMKKLKALVDALS